MVSIQDILGMGRPKPFAQPQDPMAVLSQPVNSRRSAMAQMLMSEANNKPSNLLEGVAGGLNAINANRQLSKADEEAAGRRSAMAQLLQGGEGGGPSIEEIERMGVLSGDDNLLDIAKMRRAAEAKGGSEFGLNLVYGTDDKGNTVAFQTSKGGGLLPVQFPNGVKPSPGMSFQDMGTYILPMNNKTGVPGAPMAKDVAGAENQKAVGKGQGEATVALPQIENSANLMLGSIDDLLNDPYLDKMLGPINSRMPNLTGDAARVQSKMDQIQGQTFLQAYDTLRGGGQITEVEGAKAEKAKARLLAAQNPKDFREALTDLRDVVSNGLAASRKKAGGSTNAAPPPPDAGGLKEGDYFGSEADIPEGAIVVDDDGTAFKKVNGQLVPVQ